MFDDLRAHPASVQMSVWPRKPIKTLQYHLLHDRSFYYIYYTVSTFQHFNIIVYNYQAPENGVRCGPGAQECSSSSWKEKEVAWYTNA